MIEFTDYMALAFEQAEQAFEADEVPVGAVIVSAAGRVVGLARIICDASKMPQPMQKCWRLKMRSGKQVRTGWKGMISG